MGKISRALLLQYLKALAGDSRLEILTYLARERSASVSTIAEAVHRSVKTVSDHLQRLSTLRIVRPRRRGNEVHYRLAIPQEKIVREVLRLL